MKNACKLTGIAAIFAIALTLALPLTLTGCPQPASGGGGRTNDDSYTFDNIADFKAWLDKQPANNASKPYNVKLNVSDLGGYFYDSGSAGNALYTNTNKYVNLDLSGSTFTSIGESAFSWCRSLTSVTIPNIRKTARFT
jgi:hypothetical protein